MAAKNMLGLATVYDRIPYFFSDQYDLGMGSSELDAALLVLPQLEFEPPFHPRVASTVDAICRHLGAGGPFLYRHPPGTDGLEGGEGAFLPCSFWLVQALARTGRRGQAEALLDELVALGGPLGLYGEEMDPATGDHLATTPSAHPCRPRRSGACPR